MALSFRHAVNERWTGLIMAFGAGAIISALAYQLIPGPVFESDNYFVPVAGRAGCSWRRALSRWR